MRVILYLVAKALSFPFAFLVDATGSYALAICAIAFIVKLCLWPSYYAQAAQRSKMSLIAPGVAKLREEYADDEETLKKAVLGLYERAGANPMMGCLPLFLQAPVFAGLLTLLRNPGIMGRSAAEEAHRAFLWIPDLTMPDAALAMPAATAAATFLTLFLPMAKAWKRTKGRTRTKALAPAVIFPFVMFLFSLAAPAGVAFYWAVSCVISAFLLRLMAKIARENVNKKRSFDF